MSSKRVPRARFGILAWIQLVVMLLMGILAVISAARTWGLNPLETLIVTALAIIVIWLIGLTIWLMRHGLSSE